ncbi:metallophosphoesterase family protein [Arenibacter algicola]|uniref:metallophosphoesterase family protein n=1 Tax=Arenibacter algicola TaxID=616991 RepID=UPI000A7CD2A0|nr:metallophosphoesterase [Arenibacter algicola]
MKKKHDIKRRQLIKNIGLATGAAMFGGVAIANEKERKGKEKPVLRVAHITDIHITSGNNAPERFRKCLNDVLKQRVDFLLNGGDTIMAADYDHITREEVLDQWSIWGELRNNFKDYDLYSCLGNHDMWWAAPDKTDAMYGKEYVVKQLNMPSRYYSFEKAGWHFIVLDSNNDNAGSLDEEQRKWLENELDRMNEGAAILVMSHYPILGVSTIPYGGCHTDSKYITKLFHKHRDKKIHCISGHMHLVDTAVYNDVHYYCNGSVSGFWWGDGDKDSAAKGWYHETPPGYTIIDFFDDGTLSNIYYPHSY